MGPTITYLAPDKSGVTITRGTLEANAPVASRKGKLSLFRKSDKLPTSSELLASAARAAAAEEGFAKERSRLIAELSSFDDDPGEKQRARQRIADIDAELIAARQHREDFNVAIPIAEQREEAQRLAADRAEQEKKSAKLVRGGAARFNALAKAYADALRELNEDQAAWKRIGQPGMSAYSRIRNDNSAHSPRHPLARASVWTLDGNCEFDGTHIR